MIAKCKAIAHGKVALDYIFREIKLKDRLYSHELCSDTSQGIYDEMCLLSDYNSRCRNKFLRIEIGIAPEDEAKMNPLKLRHLVVEFIRSMGLERHQAVAVTHKDTDNLHIHIIANRISLDRAVYDTSFVSNRAARVAEELSRKHGLSIANERIASRHYRKPRASRTREAVKDQLRGIAYGLLATNMKGGVKGYAAFRQDLIQQGVTVEPMRNKSGRIYGMKFHFEGQTFKASEIGREFGYNSLLKQFGLDCLSSYAQNSVVPIYTPQERTPTELSQGTTREESLVETMVDMVDGVASSVGGLLDFQMHGDDYAEIAFQRKLRNEANRKKKRGRRI